MDVIARLRPEIVKLRKISYSVVDNRLIVESNSDIIVNGRWTKTFTIPTDLVNNDFYLIYNIQTDEGIFTTTEPNISLQGSTIVVNDNRYNISEILILNVKRTQLGNDLTDDINTIQSYINNISTTVVNLQTDINNVQQEIDNIEGLVNTLGTDIDSLQAAIDSLTTETTTLSSHISSIRSDITSIEGNVYSLQSSITNINTQLDLIGVDLTTLASKVNSLSIYETYSKLTVSNSFPSNPSHNHLVWRTDEVKLYRFDSVSNNWIEIDWKRVVKASPEWDVGRLRINSSTGKLEISPDGSNWYECIPAVGANAIELLTIDNTSYSYKYWIPPGQTVIIRNANHIPICYTPVVEPFYSGGYWNSYYGSYNRRGLRPSNTTISNGDIQISYGYGSSAGAARYTSLNIVPIIEHYSSENWAHFELIIRSTQKFLVNAIGQGYAGYEVIVVNSSGTAATGSYWLGTWYDQAGNQFSVPVLTLTRKA